MKDAIIFTSVMFVFWLISFIEESIKRHKKVNN